MFHGPSWSELPETESGGFSVDGLQPFLKQYMVVRHKM
jgi:hypothetical protein